MPVESAADRLIFLDVDDFGATASYTVQGGSAANITGIFDNEFIEVDACLLYTSPSPRDS